MYVVCEPLQKNAYLGARSLGPHWLDSSMWVVSGAWVGQGAGRDHYHPSHPTSDSLLAHFDPSWDRPPEQLAVEACRLATALSPWKHNGKRFNEEMPGDRNC